jgi:DNA-binding PadR family transcriptional regulator
VPRCRGIALPEGQQSARPYIGTLDTITRVAIVAEVKDAFDPSGYLPLTPSMFQVLLALADGEKHGYAILKEVQRRTGGSVRLSAGTLYALVKRFVQSGLIVESEERPDPALDDERRRYYRLSDDGRAVAVAEARRMEQAVHHARVKLLIPKTQGT